MNEIHLFGETHGFANDLIYQKKIINKISPEYFLYEMLEDKSLTTKSQIERFLKIKNTQIFSVISSYGELKPTIKMAYNNSLKIIGCDIKNMGRKDSSFLSKKQLNSKEKAFEERLLKKREENHARIILKYAHISNKPIFASLGAYHLRRNSFLLKKLKNKKLILYLPYYNNNRVVGPKEGMDPKKIYFKKICY